MQPPGHGSPPGGPFGPYQSGQGQYPAQPQAPGYAPPQQSPYGAAPQPPAGPPQPYPAPQQPYPQPVSPPTPQGAFGAPAGPPAGPPMGQAFGPPVPPTGQAFGGPGQPYGPAGTGPGTLNPALVAGRPGPVAPGPYKTDHIKPRVGGLGVAGIGLLLLALNGYTLWSSEEFYPKALFFAFPLLLVGGWMTVVGKPVDSHTGQPKTWSTIGAGAFGAIGVVISIGAIWFVGC